MERGTRRHISPADAAESMPIMHGKGYAQAAGSALPPAGGPIAGQRTGRAKLNDIGPSSVNPISGI